MNDPYDTKPTQSNVIQIINRNVGLKCFFINFIKMFISYYRYICKTASVDNYKAISVEFSSILLQQYYPNKTKNEWINQLSKSLVV